MKVFGFTTFVNGFPCNQELEGGIIFAIPYFRTIGTMLARYFIGSLNSSSVGLKTGPSGILGIGVHAC